MDVAVNLWAALAPHLTSQGWATLASIATVLAGAVTVLAAFWSPPVRRIVKAVLGVLAYLDPLRGLKRDNVEFRETLASITKELRPNGGSSLTDKVNAVVVQLSSIHERQGVVAANTEMLLDESSALLWRSDTNGRQVWASRALIAASGRPASELLGMGWVNTIHGADQERIRKAWQVCIVEARIFEARCRFASMDGGILGGRLVAKPFTFDGQIIGWIGCATLDEPTAEPARRSAPRARR